MILSSHETKNACRNRAIVSGLLWTALLITPLYSAELELIQTTKIWDAAPHNAFTDLVRWNERFYCAFREGQGHAGDLGKLRVLVSDDGDHWESAALLSMDEYDLRDAAISVTPDNRLMVLGGAQQTNDGNRQTGTAVSYSTDGQEFTEPRMVIPLGRWLWRVTWHDDMAYGVSYGTNDNRPHSALLKSSDGQSYESVTDELLGEGEWPTEARIRFTGDGTAYCLHRRDGKGNTTYWGIAKPPYTTWDWHDSGTRLGGPNFLQLPTGEWIAAGRLYDGGARTELLEINPETGAMRPLVRLPSGGDTSYPGMVWHDGVLWVSYYASHEGKTSIYLSKLRLRDESAIDIGNRLELFVDRHLIDHLDDIELRLHEPRPAETVLNFDKPWEGAFCGYATVIHDGDRYRMYYRGLPEAGLDGTDSEVTCYADSADGIHWEKPNLGIYEVDGSRENNVVLSGETPASHNFSPFLDRNPSAPADERYKALGGTSKGLIGFVSADGLKWNRIQKEPVFTQGVFDSQNVSFYSESEHQYVCYFRTWTKTNYGGFRTVSRTTSKDFINWSEPIQMTFGDTRLEHLYTNQTAPYFRAPHLYLAVAARFMPGRQVITQQEAELIGVNPKYYGDCSDCVLLTSRGGNAYERTFMESFIRPGLGLENWVSRTNYPALNVVPTGDEEISIYLQRNYGQPTSHIQRFTLRTDGFASLHANYQSGEVVTKPIVFHEADILTLTLNYSTSAAGSIIVELQDAQGEVMPGFSAKECVPVIGDRIAGVVNWSSERQLSQLAGIPVRIRFVLKDADLYSMQFKPM